MKRKIELQKLQMNYLNMNCASCLVFKLSLTDWTHHREICISVRIVRFQVDRFEFLQLRMHFGSMLSVYKNKNIQDNNSGLKTFE